MAYQPGADPWGRAPAGNEMDWWNTQKKPDTYGAATGWANKNVPGMLGDAWGNIKNLTNQSLALGNRGSGFETWLDPRNPRIGGYASGAMGEARNAANLAANQLANAGVAGSRGGFGVAGASPMAGNLAHDAIGNVANKASDSWKWGAEMTARGAPLAQQDWQFKLNNLGNLGNSMSSFAGNMGGLWRDLLGGASAENMGWLDRLGGANQRDIAAQRALYNQYPQDIQGYNTWKQGLTDRNQQQQQQGDLNSLMDRVSRYENVTLNDPRWADISKLRMMSNMSSGRPLFPGMG